MLFSGQLVNLRAFKQEDIKIVTEFMSDPELMYNLDFSAPLPQSYEAQKNSIEEAWKNKDTHKHFELAIETKDGKFIGGLGLNHMDRKNRIAEVGIFIGDKGYQSKGYGTDAMKLLLQLLFEEYNANKVKLGVFSFNKRAIRSYEKCGFKTEAVIRETLYRFGTYNDVIQMAILREEYFNNRGV